MNCKAIFCFDTATVRFAIYPDGYEGPRILAQIDDPALRDHFGARGGGESLVDAYQANALEIDAKALKKYRLVSSSTVVLQAEDFDMPYRTAAAHGISGGSGLGEMKQAAV